MSGTVVAAVELGGLAAIAEMLDPEVFRETVRDLVGRAREPLVQEGASVEVSPGHTLIATWSTLDGATAAVRAGLAILKAVEAAATAAEARHSVRFWTRIGVHGGDGTPEVLAGVAGALKGCGRHDTILVSRAVRRLIRSEFQILPLAPVRLLSDKKPEPTFEVVGAKVAKQAADRAPFVGRQTEGRQLLDLMKLTHHHGPQVVDLVGEAGMGKTRLAHEFCHRVAHRGLGRVLRGRAQPESDGRAGSLVDTLIRSWLGVGSTALPEEILLRLQAELASFQLPAPERSAALIGMLLGVEVPEPDVLSLSPYQKRSAGYRAFDDVLLQMARQAFLLLFLDDLLWADDASLAWLHGLLQALEDTPDLPILIVASYRPEADSDLGEGFGPARWRVNLEGLGKREARRMAAGLLGQDGGLETIAEPAARALLESAVDRAAGNPLYLSEIIQALVEREALTRDQTGWHRGAPVAALPVPASLHEALADRLEQVDSVLLKTLQAAAALGRDFSPGLLARLLDVQDIQGILAELTLHGLVAPLDNGDYAFSPAAAHDIVYRAMTETSRKDLHRRAAAAIEQVQSPSKQSNPVPLARHLLLSDEPGLAIPHLLGAGERAMAAGSAGEAISCYSRALELLAVRPDAAPRDRILLGLADAQAADGCFEEAVRTIETILTEAGPHADPLLCLKLGQVLRRGARLQEARSAFNRGLALLEADMNPRALALIRIDLAELECESGNYASADASARQALLLQKPSDHPEDAGRVLMVLARCAVHSGDPAGGVEAFRQAASLRERIRDQIGMSASLVELGQVLRVLGDWLEAQRVLEQARLAAAMVGDRRQEARARLALAELALDQGASVSAQEHLTSAHDAFLESSDLVMMGLARLRLGEAALIHENAAEAGKRVEEGLAIAHALNDDFLRISFHRLAAQVAQRRGEPFRAHLDAAEQVADATGDKSLREEVYRCAADLSLENKDLAAANAYARRASQLADEKARPLAAGRTFAMWARIYAAQGDPDKGDDFDAKAFGIFNRLGAKRDLDLLEQTI